MKTLYGITGIRVFIAQKIEAVNAFLEQHDGNIIDIQCTDNYFHVIYKATEE